VAAKTLNIRTSPETDGLLAAQPLPKGTMVSIVGEKNGWYKVRTTVEGWVFGKYLDIN
jgi:N-acetylmuramoyl-L-alanine amidase